MDSISAIQNLSQPFTFLSVTSVHKRFSLYALLFIRILKFYLISALNPNPKHLFNFLSKYSYKSVDIDPFTEFWNILGNGIWIVCNKKHTIISKCLVATCWCIYFLTQFIHKWSINNLPYEFIINRHIFLWLFID